MTVSELRKHALTQLSTTQTPELDIAIFLSIILKKTKSQIMAHPEIEVSLDQEKQFFDAIDQRKSGLPVAYITGTREFWGLSFHVTPSVLIPKPDTEILVERALSILETHSKKKQIPPQVLDVCTGSGCIAIALKHSIPEVNITATDISTQALTIAKYNSEKIVDGTITFIEGDLRTGLPSTPEGWNLIVSNPPYVPSTTAHSLLEDGRNEPLLALDGGTDGLDLIRELIPQAFKLLASDGYLLIETGEYNAQETVTYFKLHGFIDIVIHTDLENQDRVVEGKKH